MRIFKENKGTFWCRLLGHTWKFPSAKLFYSLNPKGLPITVDDYKCLRCNIKRSLSLEYQKETKPNIRTYYYPELQKMCRKMKEEEARNK